jgi:hypothetical protein
MEELTFNTKEEYDKYFIEVEMPMIEKCVKYLIQIGFLEELNKKGV